MVLGQINFGVAGFIEMHVKRADGSVAKAAFKNLILDTFFNRFAANNTMTGSGMLCRVGTGVTPPANGDTSLVSQVASKTRTSGSEVFGSIDITNNRIVAKSINQFIFDVGAVSANIGEVGFEFAPGTDGVNAGSLNSRSLTKDSFGTPTPITVTATDQLIVNYTIEVYIPLIDYTTTVAIDINGTVTNHDVIGRIAANYGRSINDILLGANANFDWFTSCGSASVFGGHGVDPTNESGTKSRTQQEFLSIAGGKEREFTASVNQLNATGGIKVLTLAVGSTGRFYKYQFTPVIPKTTDFNLKFRVRMTCSRV